MAEKTSVLDQETKQQIQEISGALAAKLAAEAPADTLLPKKALEKKIQLDVENQITELFENFMGGFIQLVLTLMNLGQNEGKFYSENIVSQLDNLAGGLKAWGENPAETKTPRNVCGITNDTMAIFNEASAYLYENKDYEKSSKVYSFLAFLDPSEPAYWIGWGNSEYFCGRYEKALKIYDTASEVDSEDPFTYFYSAHCYHELNQIDKALQTTDKALHIIKQHPSMKELQKKAEALKTFFTNFKK